MKILGIETSCDETSAAVVEDGCEILSNIVLSQTSSHKKFSGVVPELASRMHLENINDIILKSLSSARMTIHEIDHIAVSNRPGLVGSLIIGTTAAKTMALSLNKPLIPVNHVTAHLYSCFLGKEGPPSFPFIGLVVSGGHTLLMRVRSWTDIVVMGTTIDDAAGEAFDKVAKLLGLPYPGGPSIEHYAKKGDPASVRLPEINMYNKKQGNFNFSYSGLKTAVYYHLKKHPETSRADICASFQNAAVSILVKKTLRLAASEKTKNIVVAGGVSANGLLREKFQSIRGFQISLPPRGFSTDNAAMVAGLAYHLPEYKFDFRTLNVYAKNDIPFENGVFHGNFPGQTRVTC